MKDIAYDIISVVTIWSILNNPSFSNNIYFTTNLNSLKLSFNYSPVYSMLLGFGFSAYMLKKYY